ncbi:hypothetical protein V866_008553 [Kwoniella sp. B9012]
MLTAVALLGLFLNTVLAYDYIGCFSRPGVLNGQEGVQQGIFPVSCPDYCATQGTIYTYEYDRWRGDVGIDQWCLCTDSPPDFQYMEDGWYNCEPSNSFQPGNVSVSAHLVPFTFTYCYESPGTSEVETRVSTVFQCFAECSSYQYARMVYKAGESQGYCSCFDLDDRWADQPRSTCHLGDWNIFQRTVQPSGFAKKQHRDRGRVDIKERTDQVFCPLGMTACNLAEAEGYECLDTELDPESCGGCMHGQYGVVDSAAGTDCTALTGTTLYSVTCSSGRCVMTGCADGYDLIDQSCMEADE